MKMKFLFPVSLLFLFVIASCSKSDPGTGAGIRRRDQTKRCGLETVVAADHRASQRCAEHSADHDR